MKCHFTRKRIINLQAKAHHYGVEIRFSGIEFGVLTVISQSGRQLTMPSVRNFDNWSEYWNLAVSTMFYLSENTREKRYDNH